MALAGWLLLRPEARTLMLEDGWAEPTGEKAAPLLDPVALDRTPFPVDHRIRKGDTLPDVLARAGVPASELLEVGARVGDVMDPRKLRAGDTVSSMVRRDEGLVAINIPRTDEGVVIAERGPAGWTTHYQAFTRSRVRRVVSGSLESGALETSVRRAGGPANLAGSVARVLQWDLDFNRDLRAGDQFEILFDDLIVDGRTRGAAEIHAVRYLNGDRWFEAYSFLAEDEDGEDASTHYYDGDGKPLQRQFLRSPLPYSRVTSRFSLSRFHPILKRRMPHYGIDYGAPVGTPVRATASGRVLSAGVRGGGGRTVRLRHANGYMTAYLHLSGYARGVRAGARVSQGQVIGFVGSSGLSTGPHLDYRVQRNGRWINPANLVSEQAPPLADAVLPAFLAERDALRRELAVSSRPADARLAP